MSKPFNSGIADQLLKLGAPEPCYKIGYSTISEAEEHIRRLIASNTPGERLVNLQPYKCRHQSCKATPWHVGHWREGEIVSR